MRETDLERSLGFADALVENAHGAIGLFLVDHERRAEAQRCIARAENKQALLKRQLHDLVPQVRSSFLGLLIAHKLDADHQALAPHLADDLVPLAPAGRAMHDELADAGSARHI